MQKALVMSRLVAIDHACILPQLPLSLAFEIKRLPHFHDYVLFEEKEGGDEIRDIKMFSLFPLYLQGNGKKTNP